jgi:hypothetical protein
MACGDLPLPKPLILAYIQSKNEMSFSHPSAPPLDPGNRQLQHVIVILPILLYSKAVDPILHDAEI